MLLVRALRQCKTLPNPLSRLEFSVANTLPFSLHRILTLLVSGVRVIAPQFSFLATPLLQLYDFCVLCFLCLTGFSSPLFFFGRCSWMGRVWCC
jgi:hypothetical protein